MTAVTRERVAEVLADHVSCGERFCGTLSGARRRAECADCGTAIGLAVDAVMALVAEAVAYVDQELDALAEVAAEGNEREKALEAEVERLEAERDALLALTDPVWERTAAIRLPLDRLRALADEWRYKGEFGWGAWQEGYGPDQEGWVRDQCSAELRAALDGSDARQTREDGAGGAVGGQVGVRATEGLGGPENGAEGRG